MLDDTKIKLRELFEYFIDEKEEENQYLTFFDDLCWDAGTGPRMFGPEAEKAIEEILRIAYTIAYE
jgi:5'-deoxynucleotidase YfbR-like HD superfamily hydrolase